MPATVSQPLACPRHETEASIDPLRALAVGTVVAGRYRVVALAGRGGMGVVYRVHDEELGVDVALKVLRPELGGRTASVERFRRELVLARRVTHKNVVRIHDIGESDGLRFLTMDYVEGPSLLEVLEREGPLPIERGLRLFRQLAGALIEAHEAGIVHRDLKPGNVLLGAGDTVYVTDFGIARSLDQGNAADTGFFAGTRGYISPEQLRGGTVDLRSDVYALGVVLYEMLTGRLPGAPEPSLSSTSRTRADEDLPPHVRAGLERCLEPDPARRYQTLRDLLADLDQRPVPWRRSRLRTLAALSGALLVAGGLAAWALRQPDSPPPSTVAEEATDPVQGPLHSVVVLPLADETGGDDLAWTSNGLAEMLADVFSERPELRVVSPMRVLQIQRDLHLAPGRYDEPTLRHLAALLEVDRLVYGSLRRAGGSWRLELRLVSLPSEERLETRSVADETDDPGALFRLLGSLGQRLLREALGATGERHVRPETTSIEAAQAYREGRERLARGDVAGAIGALERAAAADGGFAEALERLSEAYQASGRQAQALDAAERAARALQASDSRLAHRVRARLSLLRGDPAEAARSYSALLRKFAHDSETLLDLAEAQSAQGNAAAAVETLRKATALDRRDPRAWFLLGKNSILTGDARAAVEDSLLRALTLQGQLRNEPGQADALNAMGVGFHQLGDYAQAIEKYSQAAAIRQRIGDDRGLATSMRNRGRLHAATGRFDAAELDLRAARRIYDRIGDITSLADVLNDFGDLYEGRGDYAAALRNYKEALMARRDRGDERLLAQSYDNVGYIYYLQGEYDNAAVYWRQALAARQGIGEKGGIVLSLQNLGFLHTAQGRWDEALRVFSDALARAREIDFKNAVAVSVGNLGLLHHYQGRYGAALRSFDQCLELLRELDDKRGLAEFALRQAELLLDLGRLDDAKSRLDAADGWLREAENHERRADHEALVAAWHLSRAEVDAARHAAFLAAGEAALSGSRPAILRARLSQAAVRVREEPAAAAEALGALSREAEVAGDVVLRTRMAETLARAELARGRPGPAEAAARRGLRLAESCDYVPAHHRLQVLLARILEAKGDSAAAAGALRRAQALADRLRADLSPELQRSLDRALTGESGSRRDAVAPTKRISGQDSSTRDAPRATPRALRGDVPAGMRLAIGEERGRGAEAGCVLPACG